MNKKILSIAILCLSTNTLFAAPVQVISDKNGITITTSDADNLLKPAPVPDQLGLLNKKERFTEKLEQLYLTKAIAEQGKQQALSAEEQQELDNMTAMFYFQRKIKQLSTDNLPNFEPLAKIQFEAKKADYVNPERVAVEHILIDTKKHTEKAALKLANDLIAQLKKGADFAQLAEKYSEDPSVKTNKGKLGLFGKGQMIKEFEDAAYAIKLNEISKPIKTAFGYHVLRKYEHKAAGPKAFAEVKDELVGKIKKEYIQSRLNEFYAKVKQDNAMKMDETATSHYLDEKKKQLEAEYEALLSKAGIDGAK